MNGLKRAGWLLGLVLVGCGGTGALSGDYVQRYVVEYDAAQALTFVSAAFLRNGRSEQLLPPAQITAIDLPLSFTPSSINTYPYSGNFTGRVNLPLVFVDFDDRRYENTIPVTAVPPIAFPEGFTGFPRTGESTLTWGGTAIVAGEQVVLQVTGNAGVVREYSTSTVGATTLTVNGGEIFGIGGFRAKLLRITTPALSQTSPAGGSLTVAYSTGTRTISTF